MYVLVGWVYLLLLGAVFAVRDHKSLFMQAFKDSSVITAMEAHCELPNDGIAVTSLYFGIDDYNSDANCTRLLQAPYDMVITATLRYFDTEAYFDVLQLYDGPDETSPLLAELSGSSPDNRLFNTSGQHLYIRFTSDESVEETGFELRYLFDSVQHARGCPPGEVVVLDGPSGVLTSPLYPDRYMHQTTCHWKIQVSPGSRISVAIPTMDIERETYTSCRYDNIIAHDGPAANASYDTTSLCGSIGEGERLELTSSGAYLTLSFNSDNGVSGRGFTLLYWAFVSSEEREYWSQTYVDGEGHGGLQSCTDAVECSGNQDVCLTGHAGTLQSMDFPNEYPNNCVTTYRIELDDISKIIEFILETFLVENHYICDFDSLTVYEGTSTVVPHVVLLCGELNPNQHQMDFVVRASKATLVFSSDSSITNQGFNIFYSSLDVIEECLGEPINMLATDSTQTIQSPLHGLSDTYPNSCHTVWRLNAPLDQRISLWFAEFDLGPDSQCGSDDVTIYDGMCQSSPVMEELCAQGTDDFDVYKSTGSILCITFNSDAYYRSKGFAAVFRLYSGPDIITSSFGEITSPGYYEGLNYADNILLEWYLVTEDDKSYILNFPDGYNISSPGDALVIWPVVDGVTEVITGNGAGAELASWSNILNIKFCSDSTLSARGFRLTFNTIVALPPPEAAVVCGQRRPESSQRIVGGEEAEEHSWPWALLLYYYSGPICGASLISPCWAVTAAHCVNFGSTSSFSVGVNEHHLASPSNQTQNIMVSEIHVHEAYDPSSMVNDIALLHLAECVDAGVSPVCLFLLDMSHVETLIVVGWGSTYFGGSGSLVLNEVEVILYSTSACSSFYGGLIKPSMICAGQPDGGKDSCQGDSGGPLVANVDGTFCLVGITSWGYGCADAEYPGVYTDVSRFHGWITNISGVPIFGNP